MKRTIYETIYQKLEVLGVLDVKEYRKIENPPYMNLNIDRLSSDVIALSHYYEQNDDLIADPDMEIRIFPEIKCAEAMTYQDYFGYRCVYPEENKVDMTARRQLNVFLNQWLSNLIDQGFNNKQKEGK